VHWQQLKSTGTDITDISGTTIGNNKTETSVQQTSIALVKQHISGSGVQEM
jgi:hypothetical protein